MTPLSSLGLKLQAFRNHIIKQRNVAKKRMGKISRKKRRNEMKTTKTKITKNKKIIKETHAL